MLGETTHGSAAERRHRLLDTAEAAAYLGLGRSTLTKMRMRGDGPRFVKLGASLGARVTYDPTDLDVWVQGRKRLSTAG